MIKQLGSLSFALFLIAATALFALLGTVLESLTDSHQFAAEFTYSNPVFKALLAGFFLNIFFSALRRYPFQTKHIPFLITHLALLLLILGIVLKQTFGLQGIMTLLEGEAKSEVSLKDFFALKIEKRNPLQDKTQLEELPLKKDFFGNFYPLQTQDGLQISVKGLFPHSEEIWQTWIKDNHLTIQGLPPLPLQNGDLESPLQSSFSQKLPGFKKPLQFFALSTSCAELCIETLFLQKTTLILTQEQTKTPLFKGPLKEAIDKKLVSLEWEGSLWSSDFQPKLVSQQGNIFLKSTPCLLFLKVPSEDLFIFAFDEKAKTHLSFFPALGSNQLYFYDEGFSGYGISWTLPFSPFDYSLAFKKEALLYALTLNLRKGLYHAKKLAPPLALFQDTCTKLNEDFICSFINYLKIWETKKEHLDFIHLPFTLQKILDTLPLKQPKIPLFNHYLHNFGLDPQVLFNQLTTEEMTELKEIYLAGAQFFDHVKKALYPKDLLPIHTFAKNINDLPLTSSSLQTLQANFLALKKHSPVFPYSHLKEALELALPALTPSFDPSWLMPIQFETFLKFRLKPKPSLLKKEENIPLIHLNIQKGTYSEDIVLPLDTSGHGLMRPFFFGQYKIKFEPQKVNIPHRIWLQDGRKITYPNSSQAYSYESQIFVKNLKDGKEIPVVLSMNEVFETKEGFRFYMANLSPQDETAIQKVLLVVNLDPFKYWLTYPAGFLLVLGIFLLFRKKIS